MGKILFTISVVVYALFWLWAIWHSWETPKAKREQRLTWVLALLVNPITATWYWYIWKRWAFIALFTPLLTAALSLPFVVRSLLTSTQERAATDILFSLGSARLVLLLSVLIIFPLVFRLGALMHLGKNADLNAMERNDWIVTIAVPVFGFGAALYYCVRYQRAWAFAGLAWGLVFSIALKEVTLNISQLLIHAGAERRMDFLNLREQ